MKEGLRRELLGLVAAFVLLFCLALGAALLINSHGAGPQSEARRRVSPPAPLAAPVALSFETCIDAAIRPLIERQIELENRPVHAPAVESAVAAIRDRLGKAAGFKAGEVEIVVVDSPEVNAFALPGGVILVCSGLLRALTSAEQLTAVLAHELGHVAAHDPLHLLYGEIGISVLFSSFSQSGAGDLARRAVSALARYRYSSSAERAADRYGIALCDKAGLPDDSFAAALERLRGLSGSKAAAWLDPHGSLDERIAAARAFRHDESPPRSGLGIDWKAVLAALP